MNRQKIGKILFWIGLASILFWQGLTWIHAPMLREHTAEELRGTLYAVDGVVGFFRYQLAAGLGMVLPILGVLLYTTDRGSWFWLLGSLGGSFIGLGMMWQPAQHIPGLFGIGGTVILFSYLGLLVMWTRSYTTYDGAAKIGKMIQLLGYSFLLSTGLLLCSYVGDSQLLALTSSNLPTVSSAETINISLALGMLLIFAGQYVVAKNVKESVSVPTEAVSTLPGITD